MSNWIGANGTVESGYGVASGQAQDPRFPQGTLALQWPIFEQQSLDLSPYFLGTINLSIAPRRYQINQAKYTLRAIKWSPTEPAEDFSFFDCRLGVGSTWFEGLVYYPHPETKPAHFQPPTTLEIVTSWISGLQYGDSLRLELKAEQISLI
ncbi:MAG: hypothetical protein KME07_10890 [Pegethrix bostrychoides GSE-TBD4-15B]|jgi:hypothetical protein|uniref:Uncharacterized protein n=1 Tax=Pegethrix bostrychoides GSE-TBD4-15B TaxID=2839662 RepID=A0A951U4N2_9CYAN|nr:hypothetical protein [Pegethrix bostrychoides GSE-TBD4-15B]